MVEVVVRQIDAGRLRLEVLDEILPSFFPGRNRGQAEMFDGNPLRQWHRFSFTIRHASQQYLSGNAHLQQTADEIRGECVHSVEAPDWRSNYYSQAQCPRSLLNIPFLRPLSYRSTPGASRASSISFFRRESLWRRVRFLKTVQRSLFRSDRKGRISLMRSLLCP